MTLAEVAAMIAIPYGVTVDELKGATRRGRVREARNAYYYYARRLTDRSWPQIARFVNRKHHTTALKCARLFHERRVRG